jgi:hypothetical protein
MIELGYCETATRPHRLPKRLMPRPCKDNADPDVLRAVRSPPGANTHRAESAFSNLAASVSDHAQQLRLVRGRPSGRSLNLRRFRMRGGMGLDRCG